MASSPLNMVAVDPPVLVPARCVLARFSRAPTCRAIGVPTCRAIGVPEGRCFISVEARVLLIRQATCPLHFFFSWFDSSDYRALV